MGFHEAEAKHQHKHKHHHKKGGGENIFTRIAKADMATLNRAQAVLVSNGFTRAKNRMELALKLMKAYKERGEDIIPALIDIHPDKPFFDAYYQHIIDGKLDVQKEKHEKEIEKREAKYSNDCGCGGGSSKKYSNDDGGGSGSSGGSAKSSITEHLPYVALIGVVGLIGVSMIAISKSKSI